MVCSKTDLIFFVFAATSVNGEPTDAPATDDPEAQSQSHFAFHLVQI